MQYTAEAVDLRNYRMCAPVRKISVSRLLCLMPKTPTKFQTYGPPAIDSALYGKKS